MSKADAFENDTVLYAVCNVTPSWSAVTNLFMSLHTGDPNDVGSQASYETTYTGYTRVTISRSTTAFTLSGTGAVINTATVAFPICSAGTAFVTHVGLGTSFSGSGSLWYSGMLSSALGVAAGVTPTFDTGSITISEA